MEGAYLIRPGEKKCRVREKKKSTINEERHERENKGKTRKEGFKKEGSGLNNGNQKVSSARNGSVNGRDRTEKQARKRIQFARTVYRKKRPFSRNEREACVRGTKATVSLGRKAAQVKEGRG